MQEKWGNQIWMERLDAIEYDKCEKAQRLHAIEHDKCQKAQKRKKGDKQAKQNTEERMGLTSAGHGVSAPLNVQLNEYDKDGLEALGDIGSEA